MAPYFSMFLSTVHVVYRKKQIAQNLQQKHMPASLLPYSNGHKVMWSKSLVAKES